MSSLKHKAISGTLWSATQKFSVSIISFLSNIVLARLLSPDDYGCIGMLSIFIAISNSLIYGGFISALIQSKETTDKDFSTVFYWNFVVALVLYLLLYFFAPYIADYYRIQQLCQVLRVQGIVLIINGFSAIQITILRRNLAFHRLAIFNIIASITAALVAIILAIKGLGVWALVCQQVVLSLVNCILLWTRTKWRPSLSFSMDSFRRLFSYGGFLLINEIINTLCDNIQGLLIGKRFNPSIMGYYSQAKKLEEVPTQSISQVVTQVTFPIYSKLQDDKSRLFKAVKETLSLMNFINFPLMALLYVIAKPLFIFLYSEKWIDAVPYFQILCIAGLVNCLQSVNYQVVSAMGRSKELFYWNFLKRGLGLLFMLIGLSFGVKGLLWGMVLGSYITFFVNAFLANKSTGYSLWEQLIDSSLTFVISLLSAAIAFSISLFQLQNFILLICQVLVFLLCYFVLAYVFKRQELNELLSICRIRK